MKKAAKLTKAERSEIGILLERGFSYRAIARAMGRSPNTVSYEVRENSTKGSYDPVKAHAKALVDRQYRRLEWRKINQDDKLREYVIAGLRQKWNPDEISGRMKQDREPFSVSKTAIYDWLYSAFGQRYCPLLYSRRYRPRKRKTKIGRVMIPARNPLTERPQGATNRSRYGHWEGDALVSGKRGQGGAAVGLERKSRFIAAQPVLTLSPHSYAKTVNEMTRGLKQLSWTLDNGQENRSHQQLKVPAFFCDPYSSWQKGAVENANKLIRRYLPKGTNFARVSPERLNRIVQEINDKPRKILKYQTAREVARAAGVIPY